MTSPCLKSKRPISERNDLIIGRNLKLYSLSVCLATTKVFSLLFVRLIFSLIFMDIILNETAPCSVINC